MFKLLASKDGRVWSMQNVFLSCSPKTKESRVHLVQTCWALSLLSFPNYYM